MSHFICDQCGAEIYLGSTGYKTGCEHYPLPDRPTLYREPKTVVEPTFERPELSAGVAPTGCVWRRMIEDSAPSEPVFPPGFMDGFMFAAKMSSEGMSLEDAFEDPLPEFIPNPKIPRLRREIIITEKIDGTNAQVYVSEDATVLAGSRSRWISPEQDNFGFARWVKEHEDELAELGPGRHYGEWWGQKIQRAYGLKERRFSLFNTSLWSEDPLLDGQSKPPRCCRVVPVLYQGTPRRGAVSAALEELREGGSLAAPGFRRPEGVVIFHTAANSSFKVTLENDELHKSQVKGVI